MSEHHVFDLWTSDVQTSKPCLPTLKACVKFQYLLYPFSFTLAHYFGFEFSVHFQLLQFFSLNRYLSCVSSTILNPRESGMKSIKSLSSRIIHSRDCSDSFHALNLLNIFLCVWSVCVWSVVCLEGSVSGGWCVWGVVCLGRGMREVVFLQQVNLLECQGASPRPPVPQQCWGKGKASGIPWRQWKYLHTRLT